MAYTLQQVEAKIKELHALNPADPRIKVLGAERAKMLGSGGSGGGGEQSLWQKAQGYTKTAQDYIEGTAKNMVDPAQWGKAMENPVIKSLENPQQSIPDLARTTGDFASMGLTDRLRAGLSDNTYAQEKAATDAASTRLGSLDEAAKVGIAALMPSMGARAIPEGAGALTKAGIYGGTGAGYAGVQADIKGEPVLPAMAWGGAGGAGGSLLASGVGKVASMFSGRAPQFKTDEDLFAAAERAPRNTIAGKDIHSRANIVDQIRMAETKGQQGFKDLANQIATAGRKTMRVPREVDEGISRLGNQARKAPGFFSGIGDMLSGGSHWAGKIGMGTLTKGIAPAIGTGVKSVAGLANEVNPRQVEAVKAMLRQGMEKGPAMSPEQIDMMRNYLAKMGATAGRT